MERLFSAVTIAVVAALVLAGCGSDSNGGNSSGSKYNEADVTFAQSMIPHHQQAVEMSKMATRKASSPNVKQLAKGIEAAQGPEITTMVSWLRSWSKDMPTESMDGMNHDMDSMPGMMNDAQIQDLDAATGAKFDQMFLTMMIEHHIGAIDMAKTEQSDGTNTEAVELAKQIEADQNAEIAQMKDLLKS